MKRPVAAALAAALSLCLACADEFRVDEEILRVPLRLKIAEPARGAMTGGEIVRLYFQSSEFTGAETVEAWMGGKSAPVASSAGPFNSWLWYAEVSTPSFDFAGPAEVRISVDGSGEAALADGFFAYPASQVLAFTSFAAPRPSPAAAFSADADQDGLPDIGLCYSGAWQDRVGLIRNCGGLSFLAFAEIDASAQVVWAGTGDFDGDLRPDVLALCPGSAAMELHAGDGSGSFAHAGGFAVSALSVCAALGDFDGDGLDDAAVIRPGVAEVFLSRGAGAFQAGSTRAIGPGPAFCAAFDMDSDGRDDLLVTDPSEQTLSVLPGDAAAGLGPRKTTALPFPPGCPAAGAFDAGSRPDALLAYPGGLAVLLQNADGTFQTAAALPFGSISSLSLADWNGDGINDAVALDGSAFSVRMGDGTGGIKPPLCLDLPFAGSLSGLAMADFDLDWLMDAATAEPGTGLVHVIRGLP